MQMDSNTDGFVWIPFRCELLSASAGGGGTTRHQGGTWGLEVAGRCGKREMGFC